MESSQITRPANLLKLTIVALIAAVRVMQLVLAREGSTGQYLSDAAEPVCRVAENYGKKSSFMELLPFNIGISLLAIPDIATISGIWGLVVDSSALSRNATATNLAAMCAAKILI